MRIVRRITHWALSRWSARKQVNSPPPVDAGAPRKEPQTRVEASDAPESTPSTDQVNQVLRQPLTDLYNEFSGPTSDATLLIKDLWTFEPGMIRRPPAAAMTVLQLLRRGNYSGAEIGTLIESDPALAQALLQHANSAWYGKDGAPPLVSLSAAARRIGSEGVHAAVMSTILEGGFARPGAGLDNLAQSVWDHMVRVAPVARHLAYGFGADPEAAFTLGLCHDVGKLVLFERIAELRKRVRREITFPPGFLRAALKKLHEPLGGVAAVTWGLSPDSAHIIATHHRDPPPAGTQPLSEVVFVAERLDLALDNQQSFDLEEIWASGALSTPFESGSRFVEQANIASVVASLNEEASGVPFVLTKGAAGGAV